MGIVFVLYGSINNISDIVYKLKKADKIVFVHADLIDGLANREASIDFLNNTIKPDGIISTKLSLIKHAKSLGMLTVMRFFVIDSRAMENIRHCDLKQYADFIEILLRPYAENYKQGFKVNEKAHYCRRND